MMIDSQTGEDLEATRKVFRNHQIKEHNTKRNKNQYTEMSVLSATRKDATILNITELESRCIENFSWACFAVVDVDMGSTDDSED